VLLDEADDAVDEDDGPDDRRVDVVAEEDGEAGGADEDDDERLEELLQQLLEPRGPPALRQAVGPVTLEAPRRLGAREARRARLHRRQDSGLIQRVPGRSRAHVARIATARGEANDGRHGLRGRFTSWLAAAGAVAAR
jgi:hypothetical protein